MLSGLSRIFDIVYPRTCVRCGALVMDPDLDFTCRECRGAYAFIHEPFCETCGTPFFGKIAGKRACPVCRQTPPAFEQARSLFLYRRTGARVVHALKYEGGVWLQAEIRALIQEDIAWSAFFAEAVLVPVPLHPRKLRSRGYNQARVIAEAIREAIPGTEIVDCLERVRATPSQTLLTREQRLSNMKGAFSCDSIPYPGRRIIVVDDVLTTGATLNAAVQAIRKRGLAGIWAFTLAHG